MYNVLLQNIFLGEDIRKQLPKESSEFDSVVYEWRDISSRMNKERKVFVACHVPGGLKVKLNEFIV